MQRFTPLLADAARPCRHAVGDRWFVDETYVKVAGVWRYVYRAVDQHGQVIDVYVSTRRDIAAAARFFATALAAHGEPDEVMTDRAPALAPCDRRTVPARVHNTDQYANNRIEMRPRATQGPAATDARPARPTATASVIIAGHAFIQNLRRGHYELGVHARTPPLQLAAAFDELAAHDLSPAQGMWVLSAAPAHEPTQQCPW